MILRVTFDFKIDQDRAKLSEKALLSVLKSNMQEVSMSGVLVVTAAGSELGIKCVTLVDMVQVKE